MARQQPDRIGSASARVLAVWLCAVSLLPATGAVLCIGAHGHLAVELPHAAGHCHARPQASTCEGHSHEEAPPTDSACRRHAEDCSDHALDRQFAPKVRLDSGGGVLSLPQGECVTAAVIPALQRRHGHVSACRPEPPPPDRTTVLLI